MSITNGFLRYYKKIKNYLINLIFVDEDGPELEILSYYKTPINSSNTYLQTSNNHDMQETKSKYLSNDDNENLSNINDYINPDYRKYYPSTIKQQAQSNKSNLGNKSKYKYSTGIIKFNTNV